MHHESRERERERVSTLNYSCSTRRQKSLPSIPVFLSTEFRRRARLRPQSSLADKSNLCEELIETGITSLIKTRQLKPLANQGVFETTEETLLSSPFTNVCSSLVGPQMGTCSLEVVHLQQKKQRIEWEGERMERWLGARFLVQFQPCSNQRGG